MDALSRLTIEAPPRTDYVEIVTVLRQGKGPFSELPFIQDSLSVFSQLIESYQRSGFLIGISSPLAGDGTIGITPPLVEAVQDDPAFAEINPIRS